MGGYTISPPMVGGWGVRSPPKEWEDLGGLIYKMHSQYNNC